MSSSRPWMTSGTPSLVSAGRTPSSSVAYLMAWDLLFVATLLYPYHLIFHHVQLLIRHFHFLSRCVHHLRLLYQEQQRPARHQQGQQYQEQPPSSTPKPSFPEPTSSLPWEQPQPPSSPLSTTVSMMPQHPRHHHHNHRASTSSSSSSTRGPSSSSSSTRTQCTPIKLDYSTKHKSEAVWHMVHNEYPDGLTAERFLEAIKQLCVDHGDHVRSARNRGAFTTDDVVIQFVRRVYRLGPVEVWVDLSRRTTVSLKWQLATMQNGWDDDWLHVKYHF